MEFELLAGLGDDDRRAVLATARRRRFRRGEVVFHEGDPGDTFHHVVTGRVAVRVTTRAGDVATLAVLGPGEGFGEGAILHPRSRRTATIVALEPTETLSLSGPEFEDLRLRCATVEDLLLHHLARQVERLSAQVLDALYLPSDKRVLRCLLTLDEVYGGGEIPLTQDDLATMAGTTRSTANRALQPMVDAGVVAVGRRRLAVRDRDAVIRRSR